MHTCNMIKMGCVGVITHVFCVCVCVCVRVVTLINDC